VPRQASCRQCSTSFSRFTVPFCARNRGQHRPISAHGTRRQYLKGSFLNISAGNTPSPLITGAGYPMLHHPSCARTRPPCPIKTKLLVPPLVHHTIRSPRSAERRLALHSMVDTVTQTPLMHEAPVVCTELKDIISILYSIRYVTGSRCRTSRRVGVMCWNLPAPTTRRAVVAFMIIRGCWKTFAATS